MKLRVPIFALALCLAGASGQELSAQSPDTGPMLPGRQISLAKVKDTFFSYVLGIVLTGIEVDIDNSEMREILTEFQTKLKFPFDMVTRVIQHTEPDSGERTISLIFNSDVFIPIPYSFLGYHPGTLRSTETVSFRVTRFAYTDPKDPQAYTPVYDLSLSDGSILLDIDAWLVYLLGNLLDKLDVRHIVFFSYQGAWIGLVEGRGRIWNRDMREYFDFTNNRIVYPVSDKLDAMGKGFIAASRPLADH